MDREETSAPLTISASNRRILLQSAVLAFLLILIPGGMALYVLSEPALHYAYLFPQVAAVIQDHYVDEPNWGEILDGGMAGMFQDLDRFSWYMEPQRFEVLDEEMAGHYVGIGVGVTSSDSGIVILSVREDGPAATAGLMSGDVIIKADSTQLDSMTIDEATKYLRGPDGTQVKLQVLRAGIIDTLSIDVTRREIQFQHIPYAGITQDSLIYVRVLDFEFGASSDLRAHLDSLLATSPRPIGIILDLRGNPGGLFSEAYQTVNLFVDDGDFIVGTAGRSRWNNEEYFAHGTDITGGLPIAVLVDDGSASASEIVAGALQQSKRAVLVGDTTFGKGLVQGFTRFPDGSGTRLTISRYYLPGGVYLNRFDSTLADTGQGLVPDHVVKTEDNVPFLQAIEGSLLLQQFVGVNGDEIAREAQDSALSRIWLTEFAKFAATRGLDWESQMHLQAELLDSIARDGTHSETIIAATTALKKLVDTAELTDVQRYGDYILDRLKQLAWERKYGLSKTYAEVIIPERPDIKLAAQLLKARTP